MPFSDGLKLEKRCFAGSFLMPLGLFHRCCGPEDGIKYRIDKIGFESRVEAIRNRFMEGWDMPPLILNFSGGQFELNDGNHRYEALLRSGVREYYVIIWTTSQEDNSGFICEYEQYTSIR